MGLCVFECRNWLALFFCLCTAGSIKNPESSLLGCGLCRGTEQRWTHAQTVYRLYGDTVLSQEIEHWSSYVNINLIQTLFFCIIAASRVKNVSYNLTEFGACLRVKTSCSVDNKHTPALKRLAVCAFFATVYIYCVSLHPPKACSDHLVRLIIQNTIWFRSFSRKHFNNIYYVYHIWIKTRKIWI